MAKGEIGFGHGVPENPKTQWEKKLGDATVTYTKTCVEGGFFIYDCEWSRGATALGLYRNHMVSTQETACPVSAANSTGRCNAI